MEIIAGAVIFKTFLAGVIVAFIVGVILVINYWGVIKGVFWLFRAVTNDVNHKEKVIKNNSANPSNLQAAENGKTSPPHSYCILRYSLCDGEFAKIKSNQSEFESLPIDVSDLKRSIIDIKKVAMESKESLSLLHSKWAAIAQGTQLLYNIAEKDHPEFAGLFPELSKAGRR